VGAVRLEDGGELRPDLVMPALVFGVSIGVNPHDEGFADHGRRSSGGNGRFGSGLAWAAVRAFGARN
jgi:hypothetical protein